MKIKIAKLPKSEVEIEGELTEEIFESYYRQALEKLGSSLEIPGFRKGKAPENVLLANLGEMKILEEMASSALAEHYPRILEAEKIDAIGRPAITITKLARKNPLGFKIQTAVLPVIKLADYKKIAKQVKSEIPESEKRIEVTEEEVEKTIEEIRKSRAPKEGAPPELDDNFAKSLGPFENLADLRSKLRENIRLEKENRAREKTRLKIVEKIIAESKMDLPELLAELELDKMFYRMESDISRMGLKIEDYLTQVKKTREDLRKELRVDAENKAKLELILNEIAKLEKLSPDGETVKKEVAHILEHYQDADPERAWARAENILTNEKVFQFLEQA